MIKNSISNCTVTRNTQLSKMHTLHLASPAPSAFCAWSVLASPFSAGLFPSLPASAFPFFPFGTFSPFFAGAFLGLGSGFGGAGFFYLEERGEDNISMMSQRKQTTTKFSILHKDFVADFPLKCPIFRSNNQECSTLTISHENFPTSESRMGESPQCSSSSLKPATDHHSWEASFRNKGENLKADILTADNLADLLCGYFKK